MKTEQDWLKHPRFRTLSSIEREILFRRHKRQPWVEIADAMNLSQVQTKEFGKRAVETLKRAK